MHKYTKNPADCSNDSEKGTGYILDSSWKEKKVCLTPTECKNWGGVFVPPVTRSADLGTDAIDTGSFCYFGNRFINWWKYIDRSYEYLKIMYYPAIRRWVLAGVDNGNPIKFTSPDRSKVANATLSSVSRGRGISLNNEYTRKSKPEIEALLDGAVSNDFKALASLLNVIQTEIKRKYPHESTNTPRHVPSRIVSRVEDQWVWAADRLELGRGAVIPTQDWLKDKANYVKLFNLGQEKGFLLKITSFATNIEALRSNNIGQVAYLPAHYLLSSGYIPQEDIAPYLTLTNKSRSDGALRQAFIDFMSPANNTARMDAVRTYASDLKENNKIGKLATGVTGVLESEKYTPKGRRRRSGLVVDSDIIDRQAHVVDYEMLGRMDGSETNKTKKSNMLRNTALIGSALVGGVMYMRYRRNR